MMKNSPYLGMSKKKIEELCSDKNIQRYILPPPYWTSELYSKGRYLRKYAYYPSLLPLCISTSHGVGEFISPLEYELQCDAPTQFYLNAKVIKRWKEITKKPVYPLYSPEVFFRRSNNIHQSIDAKGTIAFPVHSTPDCDEVSDKRIYISKLKKLPKKYQPVVVCLHFHDINKGLHKEYLKSGIPVVTAGNTSDYRFIERLYEILRHFKYSTSNGLVSALFYSIEMGIPFFLLGSSDFFNKSDSSIPKGRYISPITPEKKVALELFKNRTDKVLLKQKLFVQDKLGINTGLSRINVSILLYIALFKWMFSPRVIKWLNASLVVAYRHIYPRQH